MLLDASLHLSLNSAFYKPIVFMSSHFIQRSSLNKNKTMITTGGSCGQCNARNHTV